MRTLHPDHVEGPRQALEAKGPQRRPQRRFDRRLEEVAKAVGGGYCRLQMPLSPAHAAREAVVEHRLHLLEGGGGTPSLSNAPLPPPPSCLNRGLSDVTDNGQRKGRRAIKSTPDVA